MTDSAACQHEWPKDYGDCLTGMKCEKCGTEITAELLDGAPVDYAELGLTESVLFADGKCRTFVGGVDVITGERLEDLFPPSDAQ